MGVPWWRRAWKGWLRIAGIIGDFQARLVLSLFYFVVVLPFGLLVRLLSDPLKIRALRKSSWTEFTSRSRTVEEGSRQF
jgi:hypothetical protein